jgi:hypothetical protein
VYLNASDAIKVNDPILHRRTRIAKENSRTTVVWNPWVGGAQQIVWYARNGAWWVQPLESEELTRIEKNSTWIAMIHVGTGYAALLVDPGYRPATMLRALPKPGGGVAAVATAHGGPGQRPGRGRLNLPAQ